MKNIKNFNIFVKLRLSKDVKKLNSKRFSKITDKIKLANLMIVNLKNVTRINDDNLYMIFILNLLINCLINILL